jgi:hypothetical protein
MPCAVSVRLWQTTRIAAESAPYVKALSSLVLALSLSACIVVPRTEIVFDDDCKIQKRQMVLDVHQVGYFGGCANNGCVALLVGVGAVATASAVISGSIAVVGNVVYWLERRGQCFR